jgi:diguanylate cyclase (GGDEF)-like protein
MSSDASRGRESICGKFTTSLAGACASVFVLAVLAHWSLVLLDRTENFNRRLDELALMGGRILDVQRQSVASDETVASYRRWSWALMSNKGIAGTVWVDSDNMILGMEPIDLGDRSAIAEVVGCGGDTVHLGVGRGVVRLGVHEMADGDKLIVLGRSGDVAPWESMAWFGGIVGGGAMVILLIVRWGLRREVIVPIDELIKCARRPRRLHKDHELLVRGDEIGVLATCLLSLAAEGEDSASHVKQLKRTMDSAIADRTRKIGTLLRQAEKKSWIDPLTRLGNRRLMDERLGELFESQQECGEDLSIVMLDIDNFKLLNDTMGHKEGDSVLSFVGQMLRESLRSTDVGIRLGGDEFMLIMLGTSAREASETAERFVKLFGQRAKSFRLAKPMSLSAGVSSLNGDGPSTATDLIERADEALYRAKEAGKGRVVVSGVLRSVSGVR